MKIKWGNRKGGELGGFSFTIRDQLLLCKG